MDEINNENKYLSLEEKNKIINGLVSFGFSLEDSESIIFYSKDWLEKLKCQNQLSIVLEKPWLVKCLTSVYNHNFAGYSSFEDLCEYISFVEKYFGVVEKLIRKKYKEGTFFALITNNNNKKYALTVGGGFIMPTGRILSPEEKLLRAIFKNNHNLISEYCCLINDNSQDYLDYIEEVLLVVAVNKRNKITLKPNSLILKRNDDVLSKDIDEILEVAPAYSQVNAVYVKNREIIVESMTKKQKAELEKDMGDDFNFDDIDDFE